MFDQSQGAADAHNAFNLAVGQACAFLDVFPEDPLFRRVRRQKVQHARQLLEFEQVAVAELEFAVDLNHCAYLFLVDSFRILP